MNDREVDGETEARIARTKERASPALDARVLRGLELSAGFAEALGEIEESGRVRRSWPRVMAIAAGLVVFAGVAAWIIVEGGFGAWRRDRSQHVAATPSTTDADPRSQLPRSSEEASKSREPDPQRRQADDETPGDEEGFNPGDPLPRVTDTAGEWEKTLLQRAARAQRDALQLPIGSRKLGSGAKPLSAEMTVANAPVIARLRTMTPGDESGRFPLLEVVSIYREQRKGMAPAIGAWIELLPGGDASQRSFLDWCADCSGAPFTSGATFIACLRPFPLHVSDRASSRFSVAFGDPHSCTLVSHDLPRVTPSDDVQRVVSTLRDDLVASLDDASAKVRLAAVTALRHCETFENRTPSLPDPGDATWLDPESELALQRLGDDADARIRWTVAWIGPGAGSNEGLALARALAFDPEPSVRRPAERWLDDWGTAEDQVCEVELSRFRDETFERFIGILAPDRKRPATAEELRRAIAELLDSATSDDSRIQIAWSLDDQLRSLQVMNALVAALEDPEMEVRRGAARSLGGRAVSTEAIGPLLAIPAGEEPQVRAMAQLSRCRLGDSRALVELGTLLSGALREQWTGKQSRLETLACLQTIALLAEPDDRPPTSDRVHLLMEALSHPVPIVRARALVAVARLAGQADEAERALIGQAIVEAEQHAPVLVRLAVQVARPIFERALEVDVGLLRELGYAVDEGYGKDK